MEPEFANWSGSLRFIPTTHAEPADAEQLAELICGAARRPGSSIRPVGAGHSSTPLVRTDDTLVSLGKLTGLIEHDADAACATFGAGTPVGEIGPALDEAGLALENYGDVDLQALAGAVGTSTHGSGHELGSFSSMMLGARMITADGKTHDVDGGELLRAVRVSLGVLGVFTELRMRVVPAFRLHRREWCVHIEDCLERLDELIARNRNFDCYWHPRRDEAQLRTMNIPGTDPDDLFAELPAREGVRHDYEDRSYRVIPNSRGMKFEEMEYMLPSEAFVDCFREVRERIKQRHRQYVGWRVLCHPNRSGRTPSRSRPDRYATCGSTT